MNGFINNKNMMLQKIKLTGVFIGIIAVMATYSSCCKPAPCIAFSADELAWIPYKNGEVVTFKSDSTGRIYTFTVGTLQAITHPNNTCTEGQNYCENSLGTTINSNNDSLGATFVLKNLDNYNDINKKSYEVWFIIGDTRVFDSESNNSNLQTKVINGITYSNVAIYTDGLNNTIYYAKGFGIVAYYLTATKEWLYKQ
jgi:hypothetical protein